MQRKNDNEKRVDKQIKKTREYLQKLGTVIKRERNQVKQIQSNRKREWVMQRKSEVKREQIKRE